MAGTATGSAAAEGAAAEGAVVEGAASEGAVVGGAASGPKPSARRTRANGRESRRKIIEAAAAVAGERGYEGTSIAKISKASGLPASSIYWHFKDKDDLLAVVVEEGVGRWLGQVTRADGSTLPERVLDLCKGVAEALSASPDFIRLGLMLALEQRPEETAAKSLYLRLRGEAVGLIAAQLLEVLPEMPEARAKELATYALAGGDGIFLAMQFGEVDVAGLFAMHAEAMVHLIEQG
ncbi:MAG: TetR/AcrR family transcriptional regulator [Actinomycetales bacterium]|nr:TetR/AcrR family transcriptional regulator [Actinomycetales bacterium]